MDIISRIKSDNWSKCSQAKLHFKKKRACHIVDGAIFCASVVPCTRAPVAQWVVRPTHTRLVPESKHDWCKNPLVFAMIAS